MTPDLKSLDIKTDWKCVYMSSFLAFVTTVQSNLFFSSLSPYLVKIDDQATQSFFGYVIASYSIGQFFGVPIFGYLSNRIKQFKVPLIACIVFTLIGNLLHIGLELSSQNRRYLLLIARISTGFGAGVSSLVFAYIAIVSSNADRPRAIAMVTLANSMGFILGPLFQAIFSIFDYPGHALFGIFHLNLYTIPAYIALAINSMAIFVIQYWFCDKKTLDEKEILCCDSSSESSVTSSSIHSNYKPDKIAIFVMNFTRFCQLFVHAHIETISTNFTMIMFGWTSQEAVRNVALYQLFHGVLSMIFNLVYISCHLDRFMKGRISLLIGLGSLLFMHLITFSWPFLGQNLKTSYLSKSTNSNTDDLNECFQNKHAWCSTLTTISPYVYAFGIIVVITIGYSFLNIVLQTLYSQILGPKRQAFMQSIMQMSGGFARIGGSIILSNAFYYFGPRATWSIEIIVIIFNASLIIIFYDRLVPYSSDKTSLYKRKSLSSVTSATLTANK